MVSHYALDDGWEDIENEMKMWNLRDSMKGTAWEFYIMQSAYIWG